MAHAVTKGKALLAFACTQFAMCLMTANLLRGFLGLAAINAALMVVAGNRLLQFIAIAEGER